MTIYPCIFVVYGMKMLKAVAIPFSYHCRKLYAATCVKRGRRVFDRFTTFPIHNKKIGLNSILPIGRENFCKIPSVIFHAMLFCVIGNDSSELPPNRLTMYGVFRIRANKTDRDAVH